MSSLITILTQNNYPEDFIAKIPDVLQDFDELTIAEILLLAECRNGYIDCFVPQYAIVSRGKNDFKATLIRSEILQWMLLSPFSETFFPNKKIVIKNAIVEKSSEIKKIKNIEDLQNYEDTIQTNIRNEITSFSLDFSFKKLNVELIFNRCTFRGGINFEGATTKTLVFNYCKIGGSNHYFNGQSLFTSICLKDVLVEGDCKIYNIEDNQAKSKGEFSGTVFYPFMSGAINLYQTTIQQTLDCSYLKLGAFSPIYSHYLRAKRLSLSNIQSESSIDLTFAKIDGLVDCQNSKIEGRSIDDGYSIIASRMEAHDLFLRDTVLHYGVKLFSGHFKSVDMSGLTVFPNVNYQAKDIAIDLRNVEIKEDLYFSPRIFYRTLERTTVFGRILMDNSVISKINFAHLTLIYDREKTALSADNMSVNTGVIFAPEKHLMSYYNWYDDMKKNIQNHKIVLREINKSLYNNRIRGEELYQKAKSKSGVLTETVIEKSKKNIKENEVWNIEKAEELTNWQVTTKEYIHSDKYVFADTIKKVETFAESSFAIVDVLKVKGLINSIDYMKIEDSIKSHQTYLKSWVQMYFDGYEFFYQELEEENKKIEEENKKLEEEKKKPIIIESSFYDTTFIIGGVSFNGLICKGKVDCSSVFFFGNYNKNANGKQPDALSIKYADIKGQLFLNDGPNDSKPIRVVGGVNLQSSQVGQFFITPQKGIHAYTDWKIIGLKYDYIYSNEKGDKTILEQCDWFSDHKEENDRQPYEQLANAYLRAGNDTKARKTLLKVKPKNDLEEGMLSILRFFTNQGTPHYKSFLWLMGIILFGGIIMFIANYVGCIAPLKPDAYTTSTQAECNEKGIYKVNFNALQYSFEQAIPFFSLEQKNNFIIVNTGKAVMFWEFRNPFDASQIRYVDYGDIFAFYKFIHTLLCSIFLAMFIIGITRIIRRN